MNTLDKIFLSKAVSVCLFVLVTFIVVGCGGNGGGDGNGGGTLYVDADVSKGTTLPSGIRTFVEVSDSGTPVDNAIVTVNGTTIPSKGSNGEYELYGTLVIDAGDDVILDVTHDTKNVGATLFMPELATITAPEEGGMYGAQQEIVITWEPFVTTPDLIQIFIDDLYTATLAVPYIETLAGTATLHTLPGGTLGNGLTGATLEVITVNRTSSLGADAASGSQFDVGHRSQSYSFDTVEY